MSIRPATAAPLLPRPASQETIALRAKQGRRSPAGLLLPEKGNKLRYPFVFQCVPTPPDINGYGQSIPKVGDWVACVIPSGILSAGTVGRMLPNDSLPPFLQGSDYVTVQTLDGQIRHFHAYSAGALTPQQVEEVRASYTATGRGHRVRT